MKKKGGIIMESLVGLTLLTLTLCGLSYLSFKIWAKSFTDLEQFYLSRAILYENTQDCNASKVVPQSMIQRNYLCRK